MIIKNEEEMLPRCLKSIKGVDEIVILDTGSTDKSIEIAKQHGAKVHTHYKWNDDFAEARNESKKHCSGDWLLIIDGDEVLQTGMPTIRNLLAEKFIRDRDVIMFNVDTGMEINVQPRMFRNRPDIIWHGAAHNRVCYAKLGQQPISIGKFDEKIHYSTFKVKADFSPSHAKDPDRTLRIMTKELAKGLNELGVDQYTRYQYYVAREWLNRKDPIKALYYLSDYVKIAPPTNELADAWFIMGTCYVALRRLQEAMNAFFKCIQIMPDYKAAWAQLHNLSHPKFRPRWEKMFHMATNEGLLFVREDAEKLIKEQNNMTAKRGKKQ